MGPEIGVKVNPGMLKPLKRGALFPLALKKNYPPEKEANNKME